MEEDGQIDIAILWTLLHEPRLWSVDEVAREVGVSVRLLQRWRSGQGAPSAPNLIALANALGRDAEWFYADETKAAA
jgi:transcriptional regulator with XRE-family HTH domain